MLLFDSCFRVFTTWNTFKKENSAKFDKILMSKLKKNLFNARQNKIDGSSHDIRV